MEGESLGNSWFDLWRVGLVTNQASQVITSFSHELLASYSWGLGLVDSLGKVCRVSPSHVSRRLVAEFLLQWAMWKQLLISVSRAVVAKLSRELVNFPEGCGISAPGWETVAQASWTLCNLVEFWMWAHDRALQLIRVMTSQAPNCKVG